MARITRDEMYMKVAEAVALRGTCDRAYVGAVLVENGKNIIAMGYNGAPSGEPHCDDIGHLMVDGHCVRTQHAEENCLSKVDSFAVHGLLTLYVTHYPCMKCTHELVRARMNGLPIVKIVYRNPYRSDGGTDASVREALLKGAGIIIERLGEAVGGNKES